MNIVYFAPEGFDYSSNQITEGLHLLTNSDPELDFMCTRKIVHHGSKIEDLTCVDELHAWNYSEHWADMIIISSGGDWSFREGIRGRVLGDPERAKKTVFIDGHDGNGYLLDPDSIALYLKRELRYPEANTLTWGNVRSFLFGVYDFHFDEDWPGYHDRDIDVAFVAFGGSCPLRAQVAEYLEESNLGTTFIRVQGDGQPLPIDEYRDVMRRSKIIVSVQGAGLDTLRFWEAMGFGAVLCSVDVTRPMVVRNAPEPHRHALLFDSMQNMASLVRLVVSDPVRWARMRAAADRLIKCHHSTTARARQLITMFRELSPHDSFAPSEKLSKTSASRESQTPTN